MFNYLLNAGTLPVWIERSFPIIQIVLLALIAISSVIVIIAVLRKPANPESGTNSITGISDSYYMQNKSSTKEGRLQKLIIIAMSCIFAFTVVYFILQAILNSFIG
ncbi:MAG: hypothetical protein E7361_02395 [Clostridiales bacterium]|nr:hypothetical protein [Clostridiales bacterium]